MVCRAGDSRASVKSRTGRSHRERPAPYPLTTCSLADEAVLYGRVDNMNLNRLIATFVACFVASLAYAGTPEQENAFVESYKAAYEAGDKPKLQSFLYVKDANPMALEFYKRMQGSDSGQKVARIELLSLSPADVTKAAATMDGPGGQKLRLPLKPSKKLKITIEKKTADSSTSSSSEIFIAEQDGKFVIPVPVTAK